MTHRRQRSRRRPLSFVPLLVMASTASALNLSQFQLITSNQIPKSCIRAYQTEIEGCTSDDFTNGRQCSATCVKGLEQEQALVEAVCGDLNVSPRSLLGIVLSGGLVDILCPGFGTTTVTKTVQPSSTIAGFSTVKSTPTITSETTKASLTTPTITSETTKASLTTPPPKTTPTSETSTTEQSTTDQATPTSSSTTDDGDTSSPLPADTTPTQNTAQSSPTSEAAQSSTSDDDTPTPFVGGSPFDPAPIEGSGTVVRPGFCAEALMAWVFAVMLILR
ncbi:hypothetical protein F5Y06DRAFT_198718 [Hypoxylon sp. FL0890]|nr:hypothetical protein F5Y06DRAFT_198718 [Hypoxylon sp. FL0890]